MMMTRRRGAVRSAFLAHAKSRVNGRFYLPFCCVALFSLGTPMLSIANDCGDGIVNYTSEQCDDGNVVDGDRCSSSCQSEDGSHLIPQCGNGQLEGNEECDTDNAACSSECKFAFSTQRTIDISSCGSYSKSNTLYRLTADIGTKRNCLEFNASNIVIDGQGHTVTSGRYGLNLRKKGRWNRRNIIVRDINVETTGPTGIYGRAISNVLLSGVKVVNRADTDTSSGGNNVELSHATNVVLENCWLENHLDDNKNRHLYGGASVKIGSGIVRRCVFKGTPQNGIAASSNMHIFNNYANGGTEIEETSESVGFTNNFFIGAWNTTNVNANNNVVVSAGYWADSYELQGTSLVQNISVDLPYLLRHHLGGDATQRPLKIIHGRPQNRGLFGMDGDRPTHGIRLINNYSSSYVPPNNQEYDGCQLGGATGIQLESAVRDAAVLDNKLVAVAAECSANAAKPSSQHGGNPNVWEGNDIVAIKIEQGSNDTLKIDQWPAMATAVSVRESVPGTVFRNNRLRTMVVDQEGNNLGHADTGGNDVVLWGLADSSRANGFVFESTHIDVSRTPNQRFLSVAQVWSKDRGARPEPQTITWRDNVFTDDGSLIHFLDNIMTVHSGWDLEKRRANPKTFVEVHVVVDGARSKDSSEG